MLSKQENDLITQTGPGTAGGRFLRSYWQPAALSEEVPAGGPPLPVQIMSEDLVLFRDEQGRPGLLGVHCSHRAADLSYGRIEDGGLRCLYHGWLYDIQGNCLEQPGEPAGSDFKGKIHHPSYPCQEVAGVIFAFLGDGEPPLLPAYEIFTAPEAYRLRPLKSLNECNYLQGNEGNIDPGHLSFLHHIDGSRPSSVAGFAARSDLTGSDRTPIIDAEETDFGVRVYAVRNAGPDHIFVRITNLVMPNLCAIPGGTDQDGCQMDWHVPIDDTHHWKYTLNFVRSAPLQERYRTPLRGELTSDYHFIRDKANRYLQDREEMKTRTFIGMGTVFQVHDKFVTEGEGPIQDRTQEHLGSADKAIIMARRMLLHAVRDVQEGQDPIHVIRDPSANRFPELVIRSELMPADTDWKAYWKAPASSGAPAQ